jgi:hypothetical protein
MSLVVPPYPRPRYSKDEPQDYDSFGLVKYHYLANPQATDGDYVLYRVEIAPKGASRAHTFAARCPRRSSCCRERRAWFIKNDNFFVE